MRLVLASASPRRAELLSSAGFSFDVAAADVDETPHASEPPRVYALRVARDKARAISDRLADAAILAADTVVVAGAHLLGKPANAADAARMLALLSGTTHLVQTAVVLRAGSQVFEDVAETRVEFCRLSSAEIDWYIGTGEHDGKAGAYAIQGRAARFVTSIEGSWSNVVGLPVATVYRMLKGAGLT
ncbi:MAG TPA: Maf family protein [Vicinamibacterales bacterium]|jgi:septum formation protein|nr:Maf family protein [Vicinamibacterales bacterium]